MIKLENVTCGYDNNVLENINLNISPNKITFIIGKNGSGKSTLGSILSGIKNIKDGKILIDNMEVNKKTDIKKLRNKIGMIFQNPSNQIIFNRVYDDIEFALLNIGTKKEQIDNIIDKVLTETDSLEFKNSNPYNLSGGEKQRIAISSILALNPKYIVFDEATSMLDINGKKDIYKLIKKLNQKGIGIIFITNIMDELIYADDILIIDNKQIYKYTKKELFNDLNILSKHGLDISFNLKIIDILKNKGINAYDENDIIKGINEL